MKSKLSVILTFGLLFLAGGLKPVFALEHTQKDGLFSMDIPEAWHWAEDQQEVIIAYPDGKTVAIDIQLVPSKKLSPSDIKNTLKEANDKMIKEGIEAHNGTLIGNKEITIDGVYATQLDFKTSPPNVIYVTYISFFNKDRAFTVTYGSADEKMRSMMDDALATFKFGRS